MKIDLNTIKNDKFEVNTSHFRRENPKGVLIVFPGAGYSYMGPCLYYPSGAIYEKGFEILNIEYDFRRDRLKDNSEECYKEFFDFVIEELKQFELPKKKYILSKSIGTRIVASGNCNEFEKIVWLTPALKDEFVFNSMIDLSDKSLFVIGDCDPFYESDKVETLIAKGLSSLVIEGADHGLDIDTDLNRSLDKLKTIISKVESFITQ